MSQTLDRTEAAALSLVRCGILGETCVLEREPDWNRLYSIVLQQGLITVVYDALKQSDIHVPGEYLRLFQVEALKTVRWDFLQRSEISRILTEFEKHGIRYLPLKGIEFKPLYPKPEYRWMSDADILIDPDRREAASSVMTELGYVVKNESDHDLSWTIPGKLCVELHETALDPKSGRFSAYFENAFQLARRMENTHRYRLSTTDALLYAVGHMMKHVVVDRGNLRNLTDLYFLLREPSLDLRQAERTMRKFRADAFFEMLRRTVEDWFHGKPFDDKSVLFLRRLMDTTVEAADERTYLYWAARRENGSGDSGAGGKRRFIFSTLFPPLEAMRRMYPALKRAPVLLPGFWIWRMIKGLFLRWGHVRRFAEVTFRGHDEKVDRYRKELAVFGLRDVASWEDE